MVIQNCEDFKLAEVEKGLKALAACFLELQQSSYWQPSSSSLGMLECWPLEQVLLLLCRSAEVFADFSGYYCLRLLLDVESPLATYFIDLFQKLEWLLETQLTLATPPGAVVRNDMPLPDLEMLYKNIRELLQVIKPAINSCRYLFTISRLSPTTCSRWLSAGIQMKREAKDYRDFSRDGDRDISKMLPFTDLDQSQHNRIELGESLGKGGFAEVFKGNFMAWNYNNQAYQKFGDPVAVKVFKNGVDCDAESTGSGKTSVPGQGYLERMEKARLSLEKLTLADTSYRSDTEASLSKELWKLVSAKHPNIVAPRGYIGKREHKGDAGLVMELMDTSLEGFLEEVEEPLGEVVMIDLMLEIAKATRFLHECALVHKDLNPRNILLRHGKGQGCWKEYPATEVKLADFGITQCIVQDAQPSKLLKMTRAGTVCYMAPELLHKAAYKGPAYQDKVDVFSYGTVCFNILTCKDPDAHQFISRIGTEARDQFYEDVESGKWRELVKGKPEYLIDLIARCWDFDSIRRPTFATICSFLQRALLCAFSSPVIHATTLSHLQENSKHSLLNLYKTITWSSDARYQVIGTPMMESCLEDFARDINEHEDMESDLCEDAVLFLEALKKMTSAPAAISEDDVGVSSSKQSATEQSRMEPKAMNTEELFDVIEEANELDGVGTPAIRVKVQDQYYRIPFKTMDLEWIVFKALLCSSMLSHFPFLDHKHHIQPLLGSDGRLKTAQPKAARIGMFPFEHDAAKSQLLVDERLIPFLMCFWEGCIAPDYAFLLGHGQK